jgi:chlorobactene glucosyltransferase
VTPIEWILLCVYFFLGAFVWGFLGFGIINGRGKMEVLKRPSSRLPDAPPRVAVLIPAKDEAQQIETCVNSVLRQDYPNFEINVIDDRSTDGTGEILDAIAAKDSRLRVVHLKDGSLPAGWGGKSWALHNGLLQANGEWLLFVDADVQLEPDVISATIGRAVERKYDLVSLLPTFTSGTFSESLLQPLAGAATTAMFVVSWTNSDKRQKSAFANGQYLCVRRAAYDAIGGHEAIRETLSEDVALARKLKLAGFRPRLGWGDSWATVRMYQGFGAIFRGWSRNFYVGSLGKPWRILGLITFLLLSVFSVFAAAAWGWHRHQHPIGSSIDWAWLAMAGLHYFAMTAIAAVMYDWANESPWYAFLLPAGCLVLLAICLKSLWICRTGRVSWRGTQYTRDLLPGQ